MQRGFDLSLFIAIEQGINGMYVCLCHGVTDQDIERAVVNGSNTLQHLREELKVSTCCGTCAEYAQDCLDAILTKAAMPT
ncbi:MAG: (2Fe-2S)-binding protein [Gammaproteobacteria bacterium]